MAWIEKHQERWTVRWRDSEGTVRRRTVGTKRGAVQLQREVEDAAGRGVDWSPPETGQVDLGELAVQYVLERKRVKAPATVKQDAQRIGAFLDAQFNLTLEDLSEYYGTLDGLGIATRRKRVQAVERFWTWCWERGHAVPPAAHLDLPSAPRVQTVAPTWAEMDAVVLATLDECVGRGQAREPNQGLYQRAMLMRCTGLRVAQVMALEWRDIDLRNKRLTVRPELGKTVQEKSGRVVPLAPVLVAELARWGMRRGYVVESNRVRDQERTARQRDMVRCWRRSGVRAEAWEGQSHHAFRKGFVSGLIQLGANREAVEYLVGHSQGIRGIYTDPMALGLREAVAMVPAVSQDVVQFGREVER